MTISSDSSDAIILVAAGEGTRLGYGLPKAYVPVGGRTMLQRALDSIGGASRSFAVVVVVPADLLGRTSSLLDGLPASIVAGGSTRQQSVAAGLAKLPESTKTVLVHDAARALAPGELFERVVIQVEASGHGVVPALPIADTVKRSSAGVVTDTVDRSELSAVQTPQGFPFTDLRDAYAAAEREHTDDSAVFAAAGGVVELVTGEALAFKVTTREDLLRAETLVEAGGPVRTGVGIDVHAFGEWGELRLAGLTWPEVPVLTGHSDGDAVAHAICDALLSAAGLGDIGSRFGVDEPRYAGAAGDIFISATIRHLAEAGYHPINVAVQIVAKRPRFSERRAEAEHVLTGMVGAPVSVAATTSDGLGFTGRDEGVAVLATALVGRIPGVAQ